jgi:hypothetical protein
MTSNVDTTAARVVGEILAVVDSGDVDALCRRVTDDVRFQFGNAEVTTARQRAVPDGLGLWGAGDRVVVRTLIKAPVRALDRLAGSRRQLDGTSMR